MSQEVSNQSPVDIDHSTAPTDVDYADNFFLMRYVATGNPVWYLAKLYCELAPAFMTETVSRGPSTVKETRISTKSLYEMLLNRCMSRGTHGGKKAKLDRLLRGAIEQTLKRRKQVSLTTFLLVAMINTSPNKLVVSSKYGSGVLTRAVHTPFEKRIDHFLKVLTKNVRGRDVLKTIANQIDLAYTTNPKSKLVLAKKEMDNLASKANIQ